MPEYSGFFTAEYDENGDYDRVYTAEQFAYYFSKFIGNGIYALPSSQLQVYQNSAKNMSVNVSIGDAYINGYFYKNTTVVNLPVEIASGSYDRIDMVVLRWNKLTRSINLAVLKGAENAQATAPTLTRNENTWELCLAKLLINRAIIGITDSLIQDTRGDTSLCGFVHGVVDQVDTTTLWNQYQAKFEEQFQRYEQNYEEWSKQWDDQYEVFLSHYSSQYYVWFNNLVKDWTESDYGQMVSRIETMYRKVGDVQMTPDQFVEKTLTDNEKVHYSFIYQDDRIKDRTFANVIFHMDSVNEANKCGIFSTCITKQTDEDGIGGTLEIFSEKKPSKTLVADLYFND